MIPPKIKIIFGGMCILNHTFRQVFCVSGLFGNLFFEKTLSFLLFDG